MPVYFWLALVQFAAPFAVLWEADGGLTRAKNEARYWRNRFRLWMSKRALDRLDRLD